jgi:hypothetical protein
MSCVCCSALSIQGFPESWVYATDMLFRDDDEIEKKKEMFYRIR